MVLWYRKLFIFLAVLLLPLCAGYRVSCWICNKGVFVVVRAGGVRLVMCLT